MSNISVTTTQSVIAVTETGGITVTTPEGQTINVEVPNSSVNVTTTTDDIAITEVGITNTDQLIEGTTNLFFTTARARQSISAGTGISYNSTTGVITNTVPDTNTTYTIDASTTSGGANLNLVGSDSSTDSVKIAGGTNVTVTRTNANTITIDATDGPATTYTIDATATSGGANLNLLGSDSSTDSVAYLGSGATSVTRTNANTITISSTDTNTTYTQNASSTSGGANLNLVGSDSTTDTIKFANGTNVTVTRTDADTITIASTDTNTTYTVDATSTTGGANLNLTGSDSSTDSVAYLGSGATTITRTDANTITVSSTDTNTTYTQNFSSTTGGTNLNLVGSDATTDTVKFANGTGVTVTRTDADTATIAIGQPVATTDNVQFNDITLTGNIIDTGALQISTGSNGNITLAPNGTGNVVNTFSDGGNLTSNRSAITGAIRSGTGATAGNYIWALNGALATQPFRGVSVDNSAATGVNAGVVLRNYSSAAAGNRSRIIFERARGTAASPTAVQSGDFIGSIEATGCNAAGVFINDALQTGATTTTIPGFMAFTAAEAWSAGSGSGPIYGTSFQISLAPTATAIQSGANLVPIISANPQTFASRSDAFTWANGKTGTTQTMALDVSGNLTVTGDLTVTGNDIKSSTATALTLSGADVAIAGDLTVTGNDIKNSGGSNVITMTSGNTTTSITTTQLNLNNPTTATSYGNSSTLVFNAGNPAGAGFNDRVSQLRVSTASTTAGEASTITFNTGNYNTGTGNYTATQSGNTLGEFFFGGNYGTGSAFTTLGPSVRFQAKAAENFSATNSGGRFIINTDKIGGSTPYDAISIDSSNASFASDIITLESSSGTDYAVLSANTAKFNVPVTTELTTTTISEGTTYTPAATVDNNISVQIDTLAGGTTVIDLVNLTGNNRGGSYNILVFNNTASGTPVQVKNTRINANNLNTHTITTGSPRIIFNVYVVGDYATATHLVVA